MYVTNFTSDLLWLLVIYISSQMSDVTFQYNLSELEKSPQAICWSVFCTL